eukprot:CAMPEP_0117655292 /NCGR_PEP_ID=MMETSP0804-20121206/4203_1 /TAXON_ID=1074897 /ORGANISM="Tetraselmis astigmatica, Strain CCMP880" /LENGTH=454 /DNA_ID=CAMNT_0005461637 /DNA_START=250 /DNA_END=1614 /DNA_ORIENTATION=+
MQHICFQTLARPVAATPADSDGSHCNTGYPRDTAEALSHLAQENGVSLRHVKLDHNQEHGARGIFAAHILQAGDVVLDVPHSLLLKANDLVPPLLATCKLSERERQERLAAILLACRLAAEGKESELERLRVWAEAQFQAPLPDCLPQVWQLYSCTFVPSYDEQTSLVFFEREELLELQDPTLVQMANTQYGRDVLPSLGLQDTRLAIWAIGSVHSRAFGFGVDDIALAPFADMLNHSEDSNCRFESYASCKEAGAYPGGGSAFQVIAGRSIEAGEELTISYGERKHNWEMMLSYGFIVAGGNSEDRIAELSSSTCLPLARKRLFQATMATRCSTELGSSISSAAASSIPQTLEELDLAEEQMRVEALHRQVSDILQSMPTTLEHDLRLLANELGKPAPSKGTALEIDRPLMPGHSQRVASALHYRIGRKMLLYAALEVLQLYRQLVVDSSIAS